MASHSMLQKLSLICLASTIVPSVAALNIALSAAQVLGVLEQRDSTCANSTFNSCTSVDSKLPSDFCCPSSDVCISLDSSSSALCCPKNSDCSIVQAINCEIAAQNVTEHPGAPVMTTKLGSSLPTCGTSCCPFGYTCDLTHQPPVCNIVKATSSLNPSFDNSSSPSTSSTTSSTTSTSATASSKSSATAVANNGTGIDSTEPITAHCDRFPGAAVAAGFFPGMLAGALLALLGVICLGKGRHNSDSSTKSPTSKFTSHFRGRSRDGAIIGVSEPIPMSQSARTDFLRREPEMLGRTKTRMKSWFSSRSSPTYAEEESPYHQNHWKMPTPPVPDNVPLQPLGDTVPLTPERQIGTSRPQKPVFKEPSMESIKVYSPPSMVGGPHGQTPVKPIRSMASQWRGSEAAPQKLSPFRTPDKEEWAQTHYATTVDPGKTMLSPSRYGDDNDRGRTREDVSDISNMSRPTTTFTDMLHGIGFPDPEGPAPSMPDMPRGLNTKKGKRI